MRRNMLLLCILIFIATSVFTLPTTWATPFTVTLDISSLIGLDIELEFDLFDNNGIVGDSFVRIDNISIRDSSGVILVPGLLDFEDGTLQGFDDSLNPASVSNVAGAFPGDLGTRQLRIDEDPVFFPTITFLDFLGSNATQLVFDFEFITPAASPDSFVALLLDPVTLLPFSTIPDLLGFGDFLEAGSTGNTLSSSGATATPIPEPTSILLMAIGIVGLLSIRIRNRRISQ